MIIIPREEFLKQSRPMTDAPQLVVVPDTVTQRSLQLELGWVKVIRRDEWLNWGSENLTPVLKTIHRMQFVEFCVDSIRPHLRLSHDRYKSAAFVEQVLSFYDELLHTTLWSPEAWDAFFMKLPQNDFMHDVQLLIRVIDVHRDSLRAPTDALTLTRKFWERDPPTEPITFFGFQRLTYLETQILERWHRRAEVTRVSTTIANPKPPLKLRLYRSPDEECHAIFDQVTQLASRKTSLHIGIILPPEPFYRHLLPTLFGVAPEDPFHLQSLNWIHGLIRVWKERERPHRLVSESRFLKRQTISNLLSSYDPELLDWILFRSESAIHGLHRLMDVLGKSSTEEPLLRELWEILGTILKVENLTDNILEQAVAYSVDSRTQSLPEPYRLGPISLHFIDYRCTQFTGCDIHFVPNVNQSTYPPLLPESVFLGEYHRQKLAKGTDALPFYTHEERIIDERHFFLSAMTSAAALTCASAHREKPVSPFVAEVLPELAAVPRARSFIQKSPDQYLPTTPQSQPSDIQVTSATSLELYLRCPYRFHLEKNKKLSQPENELELEAKDAGTLIHAWLEKTVGQPDPSFTLDSFTELAKIHWPTTFEVTPVYFESLVKSLYDNWKNPVIKENDRVRRLDRRVTARESVFGPLALSETLMLRGRIDRIDQTPDGIVLVDYKTGLDKLTQKDLRGEGILLQPFLYAEAITQSMNQKVAAVEYVFLKELEPVVRIEPLSVKAKAEEVLSRIRSGLFPPEPHSRSECQRCPFQESCPVGAGE